MGEGIIAAIGAAFGAIAVGIVRLIKAAKSRNETRDQEYSHTEKLVQLYQSSNSTFETINKQMELLAQSCKEKQELTSKEINEVKEHIITLTENEANFNKMYLRHSILRVYFTYEKEKELPLAEWESVLGLYDVYTSLGGNGFVHEKVEEMKEWKKR